MAYCVKVHELIEKPFRVVRGVSTGIGVLDGGPHPPRGRFWGFSRPLVLMDFHRASAKEKRIRLVCEKFIIFPLFHTDNISTESLLNAVLKMYFVMRSKLAFTKNMLTFNSDFTKKSRLAATLLRKRHHSVAG